MGSRVHFLVSAILSLSVYNSHGCEMNGVISWLLPVPVSFQDVYRGVVFTGTTTNIQGINSVVYVEGLTSEQYLDFSIVNSELIISTTDAFQYYEENETAETMSVTVTFSCSGGSTRSLVFQIQVEDTNNNAPEFKPTNEYEFTIAPPVPPGYTITGCVSDMTVRDIDLTTERINFEIEQNPYFAIEYDADSSTIPKEFKAIVKTTTLIRSIPEPITLTISATDMDRTNDSPLTRFATIRIVADSEFQFPEEPLFSQSFYLADYSNDHQLTLASPISLRQGCDDLVQFNLYSYEGYTNNFALSVNDNEITMSIISPLPLNVLTESQIYLIVTAEREYTSGASATIIVQLPEVVNLQFQQNLYNGRIVEQTLQLEHLILTQGYEDGYSVTLSGDFTSYFVANIQGNRVSITMLLLNTDLIEQNNFISFEVTAYNDHSTTTAVVTLDIVKDDNITPVFGKAVYSGTYATETGLLLESIEIIQGFDDSVSILLSGDYFEYFQFIQNGPIINLQALPLPQEIFRELNLLLTLEARKPRTVGATTVISISLPPEVLIEFEKSHYEGIILDNNLQLPNLILTQGYEDGVSVSLSEEFSNFFTANVQENIITLVMIPLSANIIEENNFINLQVIAGNSRSSTTTVVTLEIIKDDIITPVFERPFYTGNYDFVTGLAVEQILLVQGYDDTVLLTLSGEYSNYFQIDQNGPVITLLVLSLPQSIFVEQNLLITVEASKPRTVGASTVVSIALPPEIGVEFSETLYQGQIVDNTLQLTNLHLSQGYENSVSISINGEFSNFFTVNVQGNIIILSMIPLSNNIIDENNFIYLQVTASTDRSTAATAVMLEIIKDDNITPVFEQSLYTGSYDTVNGLNLEEILLVQGYDDTVILSLSGEHSDYFQFNQNGPVITLLVSPLPQSVLIEQNLLVFIEASKSRTVGATAVVLIALPPDISIEFYNLLHEGQIVDNSLQLPNLLLRQGYENGFSVDINGEFSNFFTANVQENSVSLIMVPLTSTIIEQFNFINLQITAYTNRSSTTTAVTLEIVKDDIVTPVFENSVYSGSYDKETGLTLEQIVLIQGYDETVSLGLSGDHSNYFQIDQNGPVITLLALPLPQNVLIEQSLLLSLDATKPRTVGASTVIYISLPPEIGVKFDEAHYKGQIVDDNLQLSNLILRQGYENGVSVSINGEHSSFFTATVQRDVITLEMAPLSASVIEENNILSLQIIATTDRSSTVAVVTLEIIKDDISTPVFDKTTYTGLYDPNNGLSLEQITLIQGFDESVRISLDGEYAHFFNIIQNGPVINLSSSSLPQQLLWEQRILISVIATKPRTVGATATIIIELPPEMVVGFQQLHYEGQIIDNALQVTNLIISQGYQDGINVAVSGEYSSYFTATVQENYISLAMSSLSTNIIEENNFISLQITAFTERSFARAVVTLEIIKDDTITPVFERTIYTGIYDSNNGLAIEQIVLTQGFDHTVSIIIEGEYANYFDVTNIGPIVILSSQSIPPQILSQQYLLLSVHAIKPRTVGASTTIAVSFPTEVGVAFENIYYEGLIIDNTLQISDLALIQGYENGVEVTLVGDHSSFFIANVDDNVIALTMTPLSANIIEQNNFISLQVTACGDQSCATAIVLLDIVKDDIITPVFGKNVYTGTYETETGLIVEQIELVQGYDGTVSLSLDGEHANYFQLISNGPIITMVTAGLPAEVLVENQLLLTVIANKPKTVGANTAVSIILPTEIFNPVVIRFSQTSYKGQVDNGVLQTPLLTLLGENYDDGLNLDITGEYATYFTLTREFNTITINLLSELPVVALESNSFLVLNIRATYPDAITGYTTVVLEIIKEIEPQVIKPTFEQAYYTAEYSLQEGLLFGEVIQLSQGLDEQVTFRLEGDDSLWFNLVSIGEGSLSLAVVDEGIQHITDRNYLVFTIFAQKTESVYGRATIIVSLKVSDSPTFLAFEQPGYLGSIENNDLALEEIILIDGYTQDVKFSLYGEFANYFTLSSEGPVVNVVLSFNIPEELIPSIGLILLELRAISNNSLPATTAIVLKIAGVTASGTDQLVFEAPYYTGYYSEMDGLTFDNTITIAEGYEETVEFSLEGESSQWFRLLSSGNSLSLINSSSIPSAVIANNQQLIFVVVASRPGSTTARATIVISFTDVLDVENLALLAFEQSAYVGSIEDNTSSLDRIILIEGYTPDVQFLLNGEFANYFTLSSEGAVINVALSSNIPEELIPSNGLILLEVRAISTNALAATTAIVFKFARVAEPLGTDQLLFDAPYYAGYYSEMGGLTFDNTITLSEGYDETVEFSLEGESSQWFRLLTSGNSLSLIISSSIPSAVLANNQQLIFVVVASRPGSTTARATIVVSFTDVLDVENLALLAFEQSAYVGSIEDNTSSLDRIILIEGYTPDVQFLLNGEFANYFTLSSEGAVINVALSSNIPEELIPSNGLILLEVRAISTNALAATTAIVFKFARVAEPLGTDQLLFDAPYYAGYYSEMGGLTFDNTITLSEGYDETVEFSLEGESSQWFRLLTSGNSLSLIISSSIPSAVLANNQQLIFVVVASRPGSTTARATIVVSFTDVLDVENLALLAFEQSAYVGSIEDNTSSLDRIILIEGYTPDVQFLLNGEFANYFTLSSEGAVINVALSSNIPEELIPSNGLILLEVRAISTNALAATTAIVFKFARVAEPLGTDQLLFDAPYYAGYYSEMGGLTFDNTITLSEGYDETVEFSLEGESSQWFRLLTSGNSLSLIISSSIPSAVLANNQQLIFVVVASRPGSTTARATIVVSFTDVLDVENLALLAFEQSAYVGSIEDNTSSLDRIILIEGYTPDVQFLLNGEFANYFTLSSEGAVINVALSSNIPEELIPFNGLILLEVRAISTNALAATTAIVFKFARVAEPLGTDQLLFDAPYYAGYYSEMGGLTFDNTITLSEGYDETVEFSLEGESSQWFRLLTSGNSLSLIISSSIPSAVLANNQQLIFVVVASRPGSTTARATIVVSFTDVLDVENLALLAFEQSAYVGSIEDNTSSLDRIILIEGYTPDVQFLLNGEFANYFTLSSEGAVINVALSSNIPEELIPFNGLILLEVRAISTNALAATTAIVFKFARVAEPLGTDQLLFDAPYYAGYYSEMGGLTFDNTITLSEGYDETVEFSLEGESSQWFRLLTSGNSLSLIISSSIPSAVLANNQQLIFVVVASRPGSTTARATIVVSFTDVLDVENLALLAFEQSAYVGSIEDNTSSLDRIILIEGYTPDVQFLLNGEFANYFTLSSEGAVINVALSSNIPEELIPFNGLILLEVRAISTNALAATTAIVFKFARVAEPLGTDQLLFDAPYYAGYYSEMGGLTFDNTITLSEGYDETVEFSLEGESSQWFRLLTSGNSLSLIISSSIPSAVLANNQQLIFVVVASRPGSTTARATIVVSFTDVLDVENLALLAFEQSAYVGSIEDNTSSLDRIILIEGYTPDVQFLLNGEFANYFTLSSEGAVINVALSSNIPEELIPFNGLILLEVRAISTNALAATTAIVFKFARVAEPLGTDQLLFDAPYYAGYYSEMGGLTFDNTITLSEGYDETVEFSLEGESSQWFRLLSSGNSLSLIISSSIPSAVLANNQQLIFVVVAAKPGSTTARATIVVSFTDALDVENLELLAFGQSAYVGSIEDNISSLDRIILIEGYTPDVQLSLNGELANYFTLYSEGPVVNVILSSDIEAESIPSNGIILLELRATSINSLTATTVIIFQILGVDEIPETNQLAFREFYYTGSYSEESGFSFNNTLQLAEGYDETVVFSLEGDDAQWFSLLLSENSVSLYLSMPIPANVIENNKQLIFVIRADKPGSVPARATIVVALTGDAAIENTVFFDKNVYTGIIHSDSVQHEAITLTGYTSTTVNILGEYSELFVGYISDTYVYIQPSGSATLPTDVSYIVLELQASDVSTVLILDVIHSEVLNPNVISFSQPSYKGELDNGILRIPQIIILGNNYGDDLNLVIAGDFASYFTYSRQFNTIEIQLLGELPVELLENNSFLMLNIQASYPGLISGYTTVIIEILKLDDSLVIKPIFEQAYYTGEYSMQKGLVLADVIQLSQGFDASVVFRLEGDDSRWFDLLHIDDGKLSLTVIDTGIQHITDRNHLVFTIVARKTESVFGRASIIVTLNGDLTPETSVFFDKNIYTGVFESDQVKHEAITLTGYTGTTINILGEYSTQFVGYISDSSVHIQASGAVILPTDVLNIILELRAGDVSSVLILDVIHTDAGCGDLTPEASMFFEKNVYTGIVQSDQVQHEAITLIGYTGTVINIQGDYSAMFVGYITDTSVHVQATGSLALPTDVLYIVLELQAGDVSTVLILEAIHSGDSAPETSVFFDKNIYKGIVQSDQVQHEAITLIGYTGTTVNILGEYSTLFVGYISDTSVYIQASGSITLHTDVSYLVLELQAGDVSSVLIFDVMQSGSPVLPSVTFSSASYILRIYITQTGLVGQVLATADNGEVINYSLIVNSGHLEERLAVNNDGEIRLSAPANSGVYMFLVLATTAITRVSATAQVELTVDAITICGTENSVVVPPLIVIDRDEEAPHQNLVMLDRTAHAGCWYTLTNHWPIDQTWLYVDENGLHTTAIDREHESIAFMALSQIQVELVLHCESDAVESRKKRSLDTSSRLNWFGPYNYGSKQWLLADTILYNSRRSLVNLIVNDINDNAPIFVGKEYEPITVGYPIPELEETVLPRALAQLKATDADIGENAALMYWSDEPILAVSPTTGFVHVRDIEALRDYAQLTVYATDRNGAGLTGSIQLLVRLLNVNHIAVVTVRDAFLDDEPRIIGNLSNAVGYTVNVLRSVVMSDDIEDDINTRTERQSVSSGGASLQLYVYGLIERVPVAAEILTSDINNNALAAVIIAETKSLEDYLQIRDTCEIPGRDTGLLVSTIILSILLFIIIVVIIIWYCQNRRRTQNYQEFSDANSLASQTNSMDQKPKTETLTRPRLDIEELKRSEKRLHEMLEAPIQNVVVEPTASRMTPVEAILNLSSADPTVHSNYKLKSTSNESEDDDEFGENKRKKSIVTFDEIVKRIIHIDDSPGSTSPDQAVYKL